MESLQSSVLGPTLFNIHRNCITDTYTESEVVLYADDTEIHASAKHISVAENRVNKDLGSTVSWWNQNGLTSNLLDYGCIVWGEWSKEDAQSLERLQNQAMRIILHANWKTCTQKMRAKLFLLY